MAFEEWKMTEKEILKTAPETRPPTNASEVVTSGTFFSRRRMFFLALIVIVAGFAIWREFLIGPDVPEGIVLLSGRIEGDDSAVAPKTSGRIVEIRVREGDSVKSGDVIAILDDAQSRARELQARALLAEEEAKDKSARDQIAVFQQQLQQSQLQTDQAKVDAEGRVRQAEANLAAAEADLAQQQASYQLALFDKNAYTRLAQSGAVSQRQGKQATATADQSAAAVSAAERRVEASRGELTTAQANLTNVGIRGAQGAAIQMQLAQQQAEIASAAASASEARAQLEEAEANLQDLIIRAPFDGTVMTRAAEPGEVVQSGTTIVTLLDLSKVYLRGFVPEGQIGEVAIDQSAQVFLDSDPNRGLAAIVSRIDPQATFTPENTYFRDDRVKQVVGVKLQLKEGIGFAKPGMPADGEILVKGNSWPRKGWRP
jgi:HlyD family secretion protein